MDKESRELAAELVGITDHHLGEHYQQQNAELNRTLYGEASGTTPEEAVRNQALLHRAVKLFPHLSPYHDPYGKVSASSPAEVRATQASVAWVDQLEKKVQYLPPVKKLGSMLGMVATKKLVTTPYYIVGAHKHDGATDLLLHRADYDVLERETGKTLTVRQIDQDQIEVANDFMQAIRFKPLTENEVSGFHALELHFEEYKYRTPEELAGLYYRYSRGMLPTIGITDPGWRNRRRSEKRYGGIVLQPKGNIEPTHALSHEKLAKFNVFDYLASLAVSFEKVDELQAVLESEPEENPPSDQA